MVVVIITVPIQLDLTVAVAGLDTSYCTTRNLAKVNELADIARKRHIKLNK